MSRISRSFWAYFSLLVTLLVFDIVTKWATVNFLPFGKAEEVVLFRDFFGIHCSFVHAVNSGAAWGMFSNVPHLLLAVRMVFILVLAMYVIFFHMTTRMRFFLVLILSGALGNVIDFLLHGHVVDMIRFVFWGYEYPVFNVADMAITTGVIGVFIGTCFKK